MGTDEGGGENATDCGSSWLGDMTTITFYSDYDNASDSYRALGETFSNCTFSNCTKKSQSQKFFYSILQSICPLQFVRDLRWLILFKETGVIQIREKR